MARPRGRITLLAQWLIAAVVIGFAGRELAHQWKDVAPALKGLRADWGRVLGSGAIVLSTYLILVEAWRATLRVWSESLPFGTAARIWFVSNLGKYVPGKVWQIAAMGAMAQKAGVSAAAAVGSSLIVNLVSIVAGFAVIAVTAAGKVGQRLALERRATVAGPPSLRSSPLPSPAVLHCSWHRSRSLGSRRSLVG